MVIKVCKYICMHELVQNYYYYFCFWNGETEINELKRKNVFGKRYVKKLLYIYNFFMKDI